jgi:hypothetical protein
VLGAEARTPSLSQMESDPTDSACTYRAQRGPAFDRGCVKTLAATVGTWRMGRIGRAKAANSLR